MIWFDIADQLLPPAYRAIQSVYAYAQSLNTELLTWKSFLDRILLNFFVQTCDIQTLQEWEALLDIQITPTETIEQRRQAIIERIDNTTPISEPYVRAVIGRTFPGDSYKLWFDIDNGRPYDLHITVDTVDSGVFQNFSRWLQIMAPAHLHLLCAIGMTTEPIEPNVYYAAITWEKASLGIVSDAPVIEYTITLTTGTGYTLTEQEGSSSPVLPGSSYSFILEFEPGYAAGDGFAVKANGNVLTGISNVYTIANIQESQVVTVEGVEDLGTPQYGLMSDDGDSDFGWVILRDMTNKTDPKKDQFFEVSKSQYGLMNGADE